MVGDGWLDVETAQAVQLNTLKQARGATCICQYAGISKPRFRIQWTSVAHCFDSCIRKQDVDVCVTVKFDNGDPGMMRVLQGTTITGLLLKTLSEYPDAFTQKWPYAIISKWVERFSKALPIAAFEYAQKRCEDGARYEVFFFEHSTRDTPHKRFWYPAMMGPEQTEVERPERSHRRSRRSRTANPSAMLQNQETSQATSSDREGASLPAATTPSPTTPIAVPSATRSDPVKVVLVQCDITKVQVDVIINAANSGLKRGGGLCGAIFAAAGTGLDAECDTLNGCSTGDAVLTAPHGLRHLKAIVHAVGPQVIGRLTDVHRQQLASCYSRSLELAVQRGLASIISKVVFCTFLKEDRFIYQELLPDFFPGFSDETSHAVPRPGALSVQQIEQEVAPRHQRRRPREDGKAPATSTMQETNQTMPDRADISPSFAIATGSTLNQISVLPVTRSEGAGERVKVVLVQSDITTLHVDAIVNSANSGLKRQKGVCGAIFAAAGTGLDVECDTLNGCSTGDAVLTAPHGLRHLKAIVHAVGPCVVRSLTDVHRQQLASCYRRSLELAVQHGLTSIAFPCVSTATYGFPNVDAAHVAISAVKRWIDGANTSAKISKVVFCTFLKEDRFIYQELLPDFFPSFSDETGHGTAHSSS